MKNIVFVLLFVCSSSFAQFGNPANWSMMPWGSDMIADSPFDNRSSPNWSALDQAYNIIGTPYVADEYVEGSTTILDKKGFTAPMRYNAANDVVEFLDDDKKTKELLRRPYITATFNKKTYEVLTYIKNEKERLAYFNRLNEGKTQLLYKPKKVVKIDLQKFQGKTQAKYKDASMYYLKKGAKPAEMIDLKKEALLLKLSHEKVALTKFIKDYELNLKNEADAVRLIEYYNTLTSPKAVIEKAQS